jgi:hypothetical protein
MSEGYYSLRALPANELGFNDHFPFGKRRLLALQDVFKMRMRLGLRRRGRSE